MRRIIGSFNNVEIVITESDVGMVEVPVEVQSALADPDGTMPMGPALLERCRTLLGDSMRVEEYGAGEMPPPPPA